MHVQIHRYICVNTYKRNLSSEVLRSELLFQITSLSCSMMLSRYEMETTVIDHK